MKTWQWILLISIAVAFLTLSVSPLLMPTGWGIPMMDRGHDYWSGVYGPWGMSWLFVGLRLLYWSLPMMAAALLTILFLDRQHLCKVPEPVDKN